MQQNCQVDILNSVRIYDKIIYGCLLGIVFLSPIIFDPHCYDSFELPKITFIRIISIIILFSLYIRAISQKKKLKINYIYLPLILFIAVQIITTFNTSDLISSLKGTHKRQEGFFTILNYIFLFYIASKFIPPKMIFHFFLASVLSATLISIYAILQYFGYDFHQKEFDRSFSTLSNPNFLGAYLIMIIPFVLYYIFTTKRWEEKVFFLACGIIIFVALLFTYSRASWIGFMVSSVLFFVVAGYHIIKQNKKIIIFSLLSLLFITILASYHTQKKEQFTILKRALSTFDIKEGKSIGARFSVWKSGFKMIREKPLFGWGIDSFKSIFPGYKLPDYVQYEGVRITADKAHNEIIHLSACQGFIGLFSYLWIIVIFFQKIILGIKKNSPGLALIAILSSAVAYLVQNQFSFSVITIGIIFWILVGFGMNLTSTPEEIAAPSKIRKRKIKEDVSLPLTKFLLPSALSILLIIISLRFYLADRYFLSGYLDFLYQDFTSSEEKYQKAVKLNPYEEFYFIKLAELYEEKAKEDVNYLKVAKKYYQQAAKISPLNAYNYSKLTKVNAVLAKQTQDETYLKVAEKNIKYALKLDPHNPVFLNNLGALYNDKKKPKDAIPYFKKSLGLSPDYNFALANIGKSYLMLKEYSQAIPYLERAIKVDASNDMVYKNLAVCYMELGNKKKAKEVIQNLLKVKPNDEIAQRFLEDTK